MTTLHCFSVNVEFSLFEYFNNQLFWDDMTRYFHTVHPMKAEHELATTCLKKGRIIPQNLNLTCLHPDTLQEYNEFFAEDIASYKLLHS